MTEKGNINKLVMELEHLRAFERLKVCMVSIHVPILKLSCMNTGFRLPTDASNVSIGGVLMQETNEIKFPIAYVSKKLLLRETRFPVIERECFALVWVIKKFHIYLYGKNFQVETDHCPLIYMQNNKLANRRVMRWVLSLQTNRFRIATIKGSQDIGEFYMSRTEN